MDFTFGLLCYAWSSNIIIIQCIVINIIYVGLFWKMEHQYLMILNATSLFMTNNEHDVKLGTSDYRETKQGC